MELYFWEGFYNFWVLTCVLGFGQAWYPVLAWRQAGLETGCEELALS